jgi:hypothetical protein
LGAVKDGVSGAGEAAADIDVLMVCGVEICHGNQSFGNAS